MEDIEVTSVLDGNDVTREYMNWRDCIMPNAKKSVSTEISHLMKDKGYDQKRAVAASLSMKRAGKLTKP